MKAPHSLQAQLAACMAKREELEVDLQVEKVQRLLAERRLQENAQDGPRYARNLPDPWARVDNK